ncbi:MAG: hypothetical protein ISS63_15295 [Desulfobacteraceae bacterium]|nr:hypothetical protein [Desulfobacteraceae bacterium]
MISYLITFILGAFTGAAGKYLADKYTDKRRQNEGEAGKRKVFINLVQQMPDLIKEMQEDLSNPESMVIREFYILPNDQVLFNSGGEMCLFYYEDQYENLIHKIKLLENHGFIYDVTHTNTPKYRMHEEFVECVIKAKTKSNKVKL